MRAGTRVNVEQASKRAMRGPTHLRNGEGRRRRGKRATRAPLWTRRGSDAGTHGRGRRQQHGNFPHRTGTPLARISHQGAEQKVEKCLSLTSCGALFGVFRVQTVLGAPW